MIVSISTTLSPATDLGFLLHKHPDKAQSFDVAMGTAHVVWPEASAERSTVALILEVDPIARGAGRVEPGPFPPPHNPLDTRRRRSGRVADLALGSGAQ